MTGRGRLAEGAATRLAILDAGLKLARSKSLDALGAREIAAAAGVTHTAVFYHFSDMATVRDAIAVHAVASKDGSVIAALIAARHPAIAKIGQRAKRRYMLEFL